MRRTTLADARLLAYHEAGHAVAAFVLKRPLASVTLRPPGPALDAPLPAYDLVVPTDVDPEDVEREVIALLAGAEAEALLTEDCDWFAAAADCERAEALLARLLAAGRRVEPRDEREAELVSALVGDPSRSAWELLCARAHALVHTAPARSAIAALAAALLAAGTLDARQAQRAILGGIAAADPDLTDPTGVQRP